MITLALEMHERGSKVTIWWTPAHAGAEGNEHADATAKRAAEGSEGRAEPEYLGEASLTHMARKTTEVRTRGWIRSRCPRAGPASC